jgi:PAS domain S-box-containing protein
LHRLHIQNRMRLFALNLKKNGARYLASAPYNLKTNTTYNDSLRIMKFDYFDVLNRIKENIIVFDKSGNIIFVNRSFVDLWASNFGLDSPEKIVNLNVWDTVPQLVGTTLHERVKEALDKEEIMDVEWKSPFSDIIWETSLFPSDDGVIAISRDITESKKAEKALRESEEKYRLIVDTAEEGIWLATPDGMATFVNQKMVDMLGYSKEELLGKPGLDFLEVPQTPEVQKNRNTLDNKGSVQTECRFIRKDGSRLWTLANTAPIFNTKGTHIANIALHTDISDRKKAEEALKSYSENLEKIVEERTKQLQEAERLSAIGATAGMVGHDIRNPLQAIAGDLYLIDNDVASLPEGEMKKSLQESVNSIQGNLLYVAKIVEDLQDYAKQHKPNIEKIEIEKAIGDVMQLITISPNHQVIIDIQKNFPHILADFSMLKRVLSNIVNNAVQAMPKGGQLTIKAYHDNNHAFFSVEDTGVGIPDDVKPKLFTPMMTTKSKGQGLGLAVAKRLVEAQGGTISFESQEGKGTTFTIRLPLRSER